MRAERDEAREMLQESKQNADFLETELEHMSTSLQDARQSTEAEVRKELAQKVEQEREQALKNQQQAVKKAVEDVEACAASERNSLNNIALELQGQVSTLRTALDKATKQLQQALEDAETERRHAETARARADEQTKEAQLARQQAESGRLRADQQTQEAELARKRADSEKLRADGDKLRADQQTQEARRAMQRVFQAIQDRNVAQLEKDELLSDLSHQEWARLKGLRLCCLHCFLCRRPGILMSASCKPILQLCMSIVGVLSLFTRLPTTMLR